MNLLIVDDQLSVISGLRNNIHFKDLGFDEVLSATSADEAMKILSDRPVEVMLTDIEMPEKNGLQLNEEVQKQYPDILRIVLTSHAVFSYAKESVRLGCFDYIVQPAPITEIEEALRKAVDHVNLIYNNRRMNEYGELFNSHRSEFLQNSILKLYSENDQEFSEGIDMLNSSGFHIHPETITQMILLDVFSYSQSLPVHPQQREVMASLDKALKLLIEGRMDAEYLVSMTADRKFLILIFSNDAETMDISDRFLWRSTTASSSTRMTRGLRSTSRCLSRFGKCGKSIKSSAIMSSTMSRIRRTSSSSGRRSPSGISTRNCLTTSTVGI